MMRGMGSAGVALGVGIALGTTVVELPPAMAQSSGGQQIAIEPMTTVDPTSGTGYFSGPYPIRIPPLWRSASLPPAFSGTTKDILRCWYGLKPQCFTATPFTISAGPIAQQAEAAGARTSGFENNNVFRDDTGVWHMVSTLFVKSPKHPDAKHWDVIVHAHPTAASQTVPTDWVADTVLVGTFQAPTNANYDGKYFQDGNQLYLVYSKRLSDSPQLDGIAAQPMASFTQPTADQPTPLLEPATADGGFASEDYSLLKPDGEFKLVETGNITKIDGKYVMVYSTGDYAEIDYKIGLAWSDTFLPPAGQFYRKLRKRDVAGVWGQPNHPEVNYLLQSQKSAWPNDVAAQVLAEGVGSIVKDDCLGWILYFAGLDPSDAPVDPSTGKYDTSHRRPYFLPLQVRIPDGATVAATSDADLATWITPTMR